MKKNIEVGQISRAHASAKEARRLGGRNISLVALISLACLHNGIAQDVSCLQNGLAQDISTNGLVAHYTFNATAHDISGNGNNGTNNGATLTSDRFGNPNSAYHFSFSSITIPTNAGFDIPPNGQFTISAWARPDVSTTRNSFSIFTKGNWDYGLYYAGTNSQFFIGDGAGAVCQNPTAAVPGTWYHVVGTYSNGNWAIYVNGNLGAAVDYPAGLITQSSGYEAIGRKGTASQDWFPGDIDDLRFYQRALSASEVGQLYAYESQQDPLASGLIAYYPFNGNANDASGNGNNGTVSGATLTADPFGNASGAYAFSSAYISIPYAEGFNIPTNGQFTISLWANPASNTGGNSLAMFVKGNWDYGLYYWGNNQFGAGDGASAYVVSTTSAIPGTWYHVTGTYLNGNWSIYVNGRLENMVYSTNLITQWSGYEAIGRKGTASQDFFPGSMDDVRFYNRALSGSDVQRLYAAESHHAYTGVARAVRLDYQYLLVGTNYQLQVSYDLKTWMNLGLPFAATSTTMSQYVDAVNGSAFYRLVGP